MKPLSIEELFGTYSYYHDFIKLYNKNGYYPQGNDGWYGVFNEKSGVFLPKEQRYKNYLKWHSENTTKLANLLQGNHALLQGDL